MVTLSHQGVAHIFTSTNEQFSLQEMKVEKVFLQKSDWVAFLGYHNNELDQSKESQSSEQTAKNSKFLDIFSQDNLGECLYTYKAEFGTEITDVAILGYDTIAIARDDGSVTVKVLLKKSPL